MIGNSGLLVGLATDGTPLRIFGPRIDSPDHLAHYEIGELWSDGAHPVPLGGHGAVAYQQRVGPGTIETRIVAQDQSRAVRIVDACERDRDIWWRSVTFEGATPQDLVVRVRMTIDGRSYGNGVRYEPGPGAVVFHGPSLVLTLRTDPVPVGVAVEGRGDMAPVPVAIPEDCCTLGDVAASLRIPARDGVRMALGIGQYRERIGVTTDPVWSVDTQPADPVAPHIEVLRMLSDRHHGGILASPEFDPYFERSGGYGYVWARDGVYVAEALREAGQWEACRSFYLDWAVRAQDDGGLWGQRHHTDGQLAPTWGRQIDETGAVLWGIGQLVGSSAIGISAWRRLWPVVARGAQGLLKRYDMTTGLIHPSLDLWEERYGAWTYSMVAVWAGLLAAARVADHLGEPGGAYQLAADALHDTIVEQMWSEEDGRFLRGRLPDGTADRAVDASLLGLSTPFDFLPLDDPRIVATTRAVERELWEDGIGGLRRYNGDGYAGGHPWAVTTLWLAWDRARRGDLAGAEALMRWAREHSTSAGLLPEQVDRTTGEPAWAVPLAWSHAMYVLASLTLERRLAETMAAVD